MVISESWEICLSIVNITGFKSFSWVLISDLGVSHVPSDVRYAEVRGDLASIISVDRSFQVFLVEGLVVVHARYLIPQSEHVVVLDWRQARAAFSFIKSENAAWADSSRR